MFGGTHITVTSNVFPLSTGIHITRNMCFPGRETHITKDMCTGSLFTDVLFLFSFFSSALTTTPLRWRSINPPRFISYHARSMDFEENIEGL